eukprot:161647-Chlamydomonas_euryale.AAC.2
MAAAAPPRCGSMPKGCASSLARANGAAPGPPWLCVAPKLAARRQGQGELPTLMSNGPHKVMTRYGRCGQLAWGDEGPDGSQFNPHFGSLRPPV